MALAARNAKAALVRQGAEQASERRALEGLQELLNLQDPPTRIEVYDNSHIQGTHAIGAMIVAGPGGNQGGFLKQAYRKFNIRSEDLVPGDDYGMMREVLTRRFKRALSEKDLTPENWPSVVILDGGKGQLSAVQEVFVELGVTDVALMAVAKGPDRNAGRETFFLSDGRELKLPPQDPLLYYIQRLRDEAHRFAIGVHRARRAKALTRSILDDLPGIGPKRKRALLDYFGSAKAVKGASLRDLENVEGISQKIAQKIYDILHGAG